MSEKWNGKLRSVRDERSTVKGWRRTEAAGRLGDDAASEREQRRATAYGRARGRLQ